MIWQMSRLWLLTITLLLIGLNAQSAIAQCTMLNVYRASEFTRRRPLAIRLFSVTGLPNYKAEPIENLRDRMAEEILKKMQESKFFSSVAILPEDQTPETGYVLEGEFFRIDQGKRWIRIIGVKGGEAELGINGRLGLVKNGSAEPVADFECLSKSIGGFWQLKGAKGSTYDNAGDIADYIKGIFSWVEKKIAKMGKEIEAPAFKGRPISARNERADDEWQKKTSDKWSHDNCADVISSFTSEGEWKDQGRVDALWFTAPSYQAHLRLLALPAEDDDKKKLLGFEGGLLPANQQLKELEDQDVYVLAVSFQKKRNHGPIFWDGEKIRRATFITYRGRPEEQIRPIQVIDSVIPSYAIEHGWRGRQGAWAAHTVLLVFPTKSANGKPVIESFKDKLEIHTEFEKNPVVIEFDLAHFGLGRLDELRIKPESSMANQSATPSRKMP